MVDKLMTYERATFETSAWIKDAGFIGTADLGHIDLIEGIERERILAVLCGLPSAAPGVVGSDAA